MTSAVLTGAGGGTWTGNGITSSTVAANAAHYTIGIFDNAVLGLTGFGGTGNVDNNSILVSISHLGDANRNGIVDIQDQSLVTNHWQSAQNNWAAGDLNMDGFVDLQDLTLVTNNWQQSSTFGQGTNLLDGGSGNVAAVPEPGALPLLVGGLSAMLIRRRQQGGRA